MNQIRLELNSRKVGRARCKKSTVNKMNKANMTIVEINDAKVNYIKSFNMTTATDIPISIQ